MDLIKQLTGKNKQDYEHAAAHIINNADVKSFEELVSKEDFLFDFIKQNAAKRLQQACNENNYKNCSLVKNLYKIRTNKYKKRQRVITTGYRQCK